MFLEKCGRFFFSKMRPSFFFMLCLAPLLISALFLFLEYEKLQDLEMRFTSATQKEKIALARKDRKERFLKRYSEADSYFLDQKIESFPLLQAEKQKLESLINHPAYPESYAMKERLEAIGENRLLFTEENIRTSAKIKEIDEKQRYAVQMDENDLKKILSLIEDTAVESLLPIGNCPQIVIKDFSLKKQKTSLQTEVFEVQMDLIKREFNK